MSEEGEKRQDAGDTVREGIRSVIGILGALKDAVEESFDDLRNGGDEKTEESEAGLRSTFEAAQEAVDDVRERLDFVTRREFDALATELAELRARMDAFGAPRADGEPISKTGPGSPTESASQPADATATAETAAPESADSASTDGPDFRFEVE